MENKIKAFKAFAIGLSIGGLLIVVMLIGLAYLYSDKVTSYVASRIGQSIDTKYRIEKLNFSLLRKFPSASLELQNIVVYSSKKHRFDPQHYKDTLLYADNLYLQFNIFDLLKNRFIVNKIHLDNAQINVITNRIGFSNTDILKPGKQDDSLSINLENVRITRSNIFYYHEAKKLLIEGNIEQSKIGGNFSDTDYSIAADLELYVKRIVSNQSYLLRNSLSSLSLLIAAKDKHFTIEKGQLDFKGQSFSVAGFIQDDKNLLMDLKLKGSRLDANELLQNLPDSLRNSLGLNIAGKLFFDAVIKGEWSYRKNPHVSIEFGLHEGEISRNGTYFSEVNLKGIFHNGKKNSMENAVLTINPASFKLENEKIKGTLVIRNLLSPDIYLTLQALLDLKQSNRFMQLKEIEKEEGNVNLDIKVNASYNDSNKLILKYIEGIILCNEIGFTHHASGTRYSKINGSITLGNEINCKNLTLVVGNSDMTYNGVIYNLFNKLFKQNQKLIIDGEIDSRYIDYNELIMALSVTSNKEELFSLPDDIMMNLNIKTKAFKWNNFVCDALNTHLVYKPRNFIFSSTSFNCMQGSVIGEGMYGQLASNNVYLNFQTELKNINVSQLFESFNNFGQSELSDKNIKGIMSGNIHLQSMWNNKLELLPDSISCETDLTLINGELLNYAPMMSLSKYIDVSELKHIRFATLKNNIYIRDKVIHIPQMDILSNALDLSISGTHTFDNFFEYRMKVGLSDVLWGKAKKSQKEAEENAEQDNQSNKTYLHLLMKGTPDKYDVSFDRKKAREEFLNTMKEEKGELKSILRQEYNLYTSDTTIIVPAEQKNNKIRINWEEGIDHSETQNKAQDSVHKPKSNKPLNVEWED